MPVIYTVPKSSFSEELFHPLSARRCVFAGGCNELLCALSSTVVGTSHPVAVCQQCWSSLKPNCLCKLSSLSTNSRMLAG